MWWNRMILYHHPTTTRHHTNSYNPSKSTSGVSWQLIQQLYFLVYRLYIKDVVVASLVPILYFTLHIERNKDNGDKPPWPHVFEAGQLTKGHRVEIKIFQNFDSPCIHCRLFHNLHTSARAGLVLGKFLTNVRFKYLWQGL